MGEYDKTGKAKVEYIWLGNVPVGTVIFDSAGKANLYYVETDQLYTPRVMTDQNRKTVWEWKSDPFGTTLPTGTITYNQRFAGQFYDVESRLHYNYYRDYDPKMGRYVQSDPIGLNGGSNTYSYVRGNPIMAVDPLGLWRMSDAFPEDAPVVAVGEAFGTLAAYAEGAITGNEALKREAMEGMECNRQRNVDTLFFIGSMGRGAKTSTHAINRQELRNGLGNPFKNKSETEIEKMFLRKGFEPRGPNPLEGKGGYINPRNGRSYHIDKANSYGEPPHVDINRIKGYKNLNKKKLPFNPH